MIQIGLSGRLQPCRAAGWQRRNRNLWKVVPDCIGHGLGPLRRTVGQPQCAGTGLCRRQRQGTSGAAAAEHHYSAPGAAVAAGGSERSEEAVAIGVVAKASAIFTEEDRIDAAEELRPRCSLIDKGESPRLERDSEVETTVAGALQFVKSWRQRLFGDIEGFIGGIEPQGGKAGTMHARRTRVGDRWPELQSATP